MADDSIELNPESMAAARELIADGKVDRDADWSPAEPTAESENDFIDREGWAAYARWHLGIRRDANAETKRAYSFPYGNFRDVYRSGVIAAEARAGEYHHADVERGARELLSLIDET
ncbi:hypothetical protein GCM10009624_12520 [Gordonia sinesedis]